MNGRDIDLAQFETRKARDWGLRSESCTGNLRRDDFWYVLSSEFWDCRWLILEDVLYKQLTVQKITSPKSYINFESYINFRFFHKYPKSNPNKSPNSQKSCIRLLKIQQHVWGWCSGMKQYPKYVCKWIQVDASYARCALICTNTDGKPYTKTCVLLTCFLWHIMLTGKYPSIPMDLSNYKKNWNAHVQKYPPRKGTALSLLKIQ